MKYSQHKASVEWKDTKYSKSMTIKEMATQALKNLLASRKEKYENALASTLAYAQNEHDRSVRRWGWTKLVKPHTFTTAEILEDRRGRGALDFIGDEIWRAEHAGCDLVADFEKIQEIAKNVDNMTFSFSLWHMLSGWYECKV